MNKWIKQRLESLELKDEETKIIGVRNVNSDTQVQLLFAQFVKREGANSTQDAKSMALYLFNASNSAFARNKNARLAWQNATPADIEAHLGKEAADVAKSVLALDSGQTVYKSLDISNPKLVHPETGQEYFSKILVEETQYPDSYQAKNLSKSAKQDYSGNYLLKNGHAIFMNVDVVVLPEGIEPDHKFIEHDEKTDVFEEVDFLVRDHVEDPKANKAYKEQKDLTDPNPTDDQKASKEKDSKPETA